MSLTLLAVITALVLGHLAPTSLAQFRRFGWYARWLQMLETQLGRSGFWRGRYGVWLAVLVPVILVGLVWWMLNDWLLGLPSALFSIAVLVYAWGPRDLDVDVEALLDAHEPAAQEVALAQLWPDNGLPRWDGPSLVRAVFRSALQRWFSVMFWFLVLGPAGALLYRLLSLSAHGCEAQLMPDDHRAGARWWCALLEWPVALFMGWTLALVGDFNAVVSAWRNSGAEGIGPRSGFLEAAACANVSNRPGAVVVIHNEEGSENSLRDLPELHDAMRLIWRILLTWLAVLALLALVAWVG